MKINKYIMILFVGVLVFNCGTRRTVITEKDKYKAVRIEDKEQQEKLKPKEDNEESIKHPSTSSKVYASPTEKYIDTYKLIAQEEMRLYNIPASITIAQGILESASGNGRLSIKANNHFGIKCHDWSGAKIYHDDDKAQECFRKYSEAKDSFRDHSLFLSGRKRYAELFKLKKTDYKGWARGLRAAGYATDKKYPEKLISLIERYQLYKFDDLNATKTKISNVDSDVSISQNINNDTKEDTNKIIHVVEQGDTLYNISKRHGVSIETLKKNNNIEGDAISIGQHLQVKKN